MLVLEAKLKGKTEQYNLIDEALRTALFVRNSCIRYWMDGEKLNKYDLSAYCVVLAKSFEWAKKLNSQARQASSERVWSAISRFFDNCKKKVSGKKGFPKFKKRGQSVEYKQTGWKLSEDRKYLTLTDGFKIGRLKLVGSRDLNFYQIEQIKRIRIVRRADGYYAQFCVDVDRKEELEPTHRTLGLDVGLNHFYTDSQVRNMVKNHKLAKSISDTSRSMFRDWVEYFGRVFGKVTIAGPPHYTSQSCSTCGTLVKKTLSTRTHQCSHCGTVLDRDHNAALNILALGLKNTVGHTEISTPVESSTSAK